MFRLPALCCKLLYNLTPLLTPTSSDVLLGSLEMLSPELEVLKIPTKIKRNSQLLGCEYFLSQQAVTYQTHMLSRDPPGQTAKGKK